MLIVNLITVLYLTKVLFFIMSAIKDMIAGECGTSNPLVRATQHLTKDHAHQQEGFNRPSK